jgi:xyloglucan-specific endo-beta-1,4-glucanase
MSCEGTCVEAQSDPANCGACGNACPGTQVCSKGACSAGCAASLTRCGAACIDITGSQANCGTCGNACPADQTCWQSACICPTGEGPCGANDACVDVLANAASCGACGVVCASGAACANGACVCPGAQIACSGACVDAASDEANCGACGVTCGGGTSCLSGACLDPSTLSCTGAQQGYSCAKDANVTLGPYWVNNNWWGADTGSGQTCIWGSCSTGDLAGWGQSFDWSGAAGAVKSYASLVFGWHWGWKTGSNGQRLVTALPLQLSTTKAVSCGWSFEVTQTSTSTMNVAYDLFAHTLANAGTNDDPTDEIMIWLYRGNGAGPLGTKQNGTFSAGGGTYDLYTGDNTRWKVHSYVRQANATTAVLDLMEFMRDLASRGLVVSSKYLSSVQAGSEIFSGEGQVQTNGFYCRVQ